MTRTTMTAAGFAATLLGACAGPQLGTPAGLDPGANETLAMVVAARGVQIYECRARAGAARPEWVFVAPEAELFDVHGRPIGSHGAGPVWSARDGSRIQGTLKARADAPVPGAIPWLLLSTRTVGPEGAFSKVTSIQRVNTVGGAAPASACSPDATGTAVRMPYTADYRLFAAR
jgi:hypothetical protein